jgi:hypothetical protein
MFRTKRSAFVSFLCISQFVSCRSRNDSMSSAKEAPAGPVHVVSGAISSVKCAEFSAEDLKSSCVINLALNNGETLRLVSDDAYQLTDEQKKTLIDKPLRVNSDLVSAFEDDATQQMLLETFGGGSFSKFFGDLPWLCFNHLALSSKCGQTFPLEYQAPADVLKATLTDLSQWDYDPYIYDYPGSSRIQEMRQAYPTFELAELAAIKAYTDSLYSPINKFLRGDGEADEKPLSNIVAAASSGLRKFSKYEGAVYRGAMLAEIKADNYVDAFDLEEPIQELAFTSTTTDAESGFKRESTKEKFGVWFKIQSHTGVDVDAISHHEGEKEVLFTPGVWFKVTGISTEENGEKEYLIIEMSELVVFR